MALTANHYELLGVTLDASEEDIKKAYCAKTEKFLSEYMYENYKTAYYVLSDPYKREQYDISLGIHKYRKVPLILKVMKAYARVLLTILDALLSFYWCVLLVLAIYGAVSLYSRNQGYMEEVIRFVHQERDLIVVLFGAAAVDVVMHFYVRRANRYLKHCKWEYRQERWKKK